MLAATDLWSGHSKDCARAGKNISGAIAVYCGRIAYGVEE